MPHIFNNKIKERKANPTDDPNAGKTINDSVDNIDIKKFKDVSGLDLNQVRVGLWFVEHKQLFTKIFYSLLIVIGAVTWPLFAYTFGAYLFQGMEYDNKMAAELVATNVNLHSYSPAVKAQSLIFSNIEVLDSIDGRSDIVLKIKNPNDGYWAEFTYYFQSDGQKYGEETNFILPGEEKYLMALGQELSGGTRGLQYFMPQIGWRQIDLHKYPDWEKFRSDHLDIEFMDKKYTPAQATVLTEKLSMNELEFTINNKSAYNYAQVNFPVILFSGSRIVGVNKYVAQNLMSGQSQLIKMTWPGRLGNVSEVSITPEINITRDDIYLQFEGKPNSYIIEDNTRSR